MADTSGQAEIRGIDIDKLAKGFADEDLIIKNFVQVTTTSATEIRWYQKTAGFLDSTDTTAITASQIANTSFGSRPVVVEQSWTRRTSYVKKFFVESPLFSEEDIKSADPDVLATNIRDLVRGVQRQVEKRIYDVVTENDTPSTIQTIAVTDEWDDLTNGIPISDLLKAREYLKNYNYEPTGAVLLCRPDVERFLLNYLVAVKGSSIPNFSSDLVGNARLMEILGFKIVSSTIVTSDKAVIIVPQRACTWKQFAPTTAVTIEDKGIGTKVRVWEEGEALLTDPKAVVFLSNVGPS